MNKYLTAALVTISLLISSCSFAVPTGFSGGVNNEYLYEEVVFITGEPIKFSGQVKITRSNKGEKGSASYNMTLTPTAEYKAKFPDAKYTKSETYDTSYQNHSGIGQTTSQTNVGKYSESLKIGGITYALKDYQFFKSDAIDNRAASDFYTGDVIARKYYTVSGKDSDGNLKDGTITVDINGTNSGYENFWGVTETQSMDHTIEGLVNIIKTDVDPVTNKPTGTTTTKIDKYGGTITFKTSDSLTKNIKYSENDAHHSSIEGGHVRVTNEEAVSKYDYNLKNEYGSRYTGTINLNAQKVPKLERLIIPKFRDVRGHWAEDAINQLYSLEVFEDSSSIFAPNISMNRLDFTKAIMKSCDIRGSEEGKKPSKKPVKEESLFTDISADHKDYQYVKSAVEKGIIVGTLDNMGQRTFEPDGNLTRAQAIVILIRALGFEHRAPNPGYVTSFLDDRDIPSWARDSIYVAQEIGLIQGDEVGQVNPNISPTRAEGSMMVIKFLKFLEEDLQKDYKDNIVNFN